MMSNKFVDNLIHHILAGVPTLRVDSDEETRAVMEIQKVAWHLTKGKRHKLENKEFKAVKLAFAEIGDGAAGLLDEANKELLVEGEKLHALMHDLAPEVSEILGNAVKEKGYKIITWDFVKGFSDKPPSDDESCAGNPQAALLALASPDRFGGHILFIFKDCHPFLDQSASDPGPRRVVRELVESEALAVETEKGVSRRTLLFLQPGWKPHRDIAHYMVKVDFELPDAEAINREIDYAVGSLNKKVDVPPDIRQKLKITLTGLTQYEITNILGISAVATKGFEAETVKHVQRLKAKTFEREEALRWIDPDTIMAIDQFAGFDNLLEWVREAREAYSEKAQAAGIKPDKGFLLLGIPGTGKSMIAKAVAKEMELPLIQFDFSSILGRFVGESEENMSRALRRISAEGPCVVFIDEADKAFSNITGPQSGSNVEQHVFGQLISWMANENKFAFVIMTMNRLKGVPIELVRSGRISATYFTTFPTPVEREEILRLKLVDNNCDPDLISSEQYEELIRKTDQYVGAEIEEVVRKSVKMAWKKRNNVQPLMSELLLAISRVRPVAALDVANIQEINEFCKNKAEPVAKTKEKARHIVNRAKRVIDVGAG